MLINTTIKRILIIDKETELLNNLKNILTSNGLMVDTTGEMSKALKYITEIEFDAIFLDIEINDIFIKDFIQEVKIIQPSILMILILGRNNFNSINSYLKSGVDNFLIKPFDFNKLSNILTTYPF